jgi:hypothetical protein
MVVGDFTNLDHSSCSHCGSRPVAFVGSYNKKTMMLYWISFLFLVISGGLFGVYQVTRFLINKQRLYSPWMQTPTVIEIHRYRTETVERTMRYMTDLDKMRLSAYGPEPSHKFIHNDQQKQSIIRSMVNDMAKDMMNSGLIEIRDEQDHYNPFSNRISLKCDVLIPETKF